MEDEEHNRGQIVELGYGRRNPKLVFMVRGSALENFNESCKAEDVMEISAFVNVTISKGS